MKRCFDIDYFKLIIMVLVDLQFVRLPYCPNLQQLDVSHCVRLHELTATLPKCK